MVERRKRDGAIFLLTVAVVEATPREEGSKSSRGTERVEKFARNSSFSCVPRCFLSASCIVTSPAERWYCKYAELLRDKRSNVGALKMSVHTDLDVFNGAVIHCRVAFNRLRGLIEFGALRLMRTSAEMLRNFTFQEALIEFYSFFFLLLFIYLFFLLQYLFNRVLPSWIFSMERLFTVVPLWVN